MSRVILALETSSTMCSVALVENNEVLNCVEELCYREHNEKLPGFIKNTLKNSNKTMNDIDCLLYTSPSPRDRQKSRMPSSA